MCAPPRSSLLVLYGPQGNSRGLLYALANKLAVFSQVYSTTGKQVSPPSSPSAAMVNFLYQPTLCLMQNFSLINYPSKGIGWLLCECELVTIANLLSNNILLYYLETIKRWKTFSHHAPNSTASEMLLRIYQSGSLFECIY